MDTPAIAARLETLERELHRMRRSGRRWRLATLLLVPLASAAMLSGMIRPAATPLVQTQRLEILDARGRLVAAIGADEQGGRLDLWSGEGRNLLRASVNERGGDLNVWNVQEHSVAALFAGVNGGAMRLWDSQGRRCVSAEAADGSGAVAIASESGVALNFAPNDESGAILLRDAEGSSILSIGTHAAGGGRMHFFDPQGTALMRFEALSGGRTNIALHDGEGRRRTLLGASGEGGRLDFERPDGRSAAAIGQSDSGGHLDLAGSNAQPLLRAGANNTGGGSFVLSGATGNDLLSIDAAEGGGVLLAMRTPRGRRGIVAGTREEGGLLNVFNRHDFAVFAASYAPQGLGGALTIRNGRGISVLDLEATGEDVGVIRVMDAEGERARRVLPLP